MTDRTLRAHGDLDGLVFSSDGLLPVAVQNALTGRLLMLAWANREALERSFETGQMHFWSRSRGRLWRKGEESGNTLEVVSLHADCDGDTVLARVRPAGPTCHTGELTCFGEGSVAGTLQRLDEVLAKRVRERPQGSYTVKLLDDENLRLKKLGEEMAELVTALAKGDTTRAGEEAADVLYHALVALRASGIGLDELLRALDKRAR